MRFFHLSDLHLGKHLHHYNLKEDQMHILKEITTYARRLHPDAIVIAGDIYDKSVPSAEAVTMFDQFLTELSVIEPAIPILIIAGNHDSGERLEYAGEILGQHHIYIAGKPPVAQDQHLKKVTLEDEYGPVHFYLLPFLKPAYVRNVLPQESLEDYTQAVNCLLEREEPDYTQRNVLVSHQFYTGNGQLPETCDSELVNVGGIDNVDISAVQNFDYVALGHLHGSQQVGLPHIRYCGTMLKYSVSETSHEKCLAMVTLHGKGEAIEMEKLSLHPLRDVQKKKGLLADILKGGKSADSQNYVSVTLTNEEELYKPREQLASVYPFLLEVRVDNERTRRQLEDMDELVEMKNPLEMYQDFYREVHGTDLGEEGVEIMRQILDEIKGDL
ncbi:MAG: exonuclease SbcCD subunit D [Eubacteriales bacterium]|nr:exonuclease SbcCD subunit D [Eubacteriales bacterium]